MSKPPDPHRRSDILKAAREIFARDGFTDARMSDIAESAGVAKGTVYLYFPSKEALVTALCEDYLNRISDLMDATMGHCTIEETIRTLVHKTMAMAGEEADILQIIELRSSINKQGNPLKADMILLDKATSFIERQISEGMIAQIDARALAEVMSGLIEWACRACFIWKMADAQRYENVIVDILIRSLVPHSKPGLLDAVSLW